MTHEFNRDLLNMHRATGQELEGARAALHLIAIVKPETLSTAVRAASDASFDASILYTHYQSYAEQDERRLAKLGGSRYREALGEHLAIAREVASEADDLNVQLQLSRDVRNTRDSLTRRFRRGVAIGAACVVSVIGGGAAFGSVRIAEDASAYTLNQANPEASAIEADHSLSTFEAGFIGFIGVGGAVLGLAAGAFVSDKMAPDYAQRKARAIIE